MIDIRLALPEKVSTNKIYDGTHWTFRTRLKQIYQKYMSGYKQYKVSNTPAIFEYTFTFKTRMLDSSNCSYMVKLLEDAMKVNGMIVDDDYKNIYGTHTYVEKGDRDEVHIVELPVTKRE